MAHTRLILRKTGVDRPVIVYVLWSSPHGKTKINTGEKRLVHIVKMRTPLFMLGR